MQSTYTLSASLSLPCRMVDQAVPYPVYVREDVGPGQADFHEVRHWIENVVWWKTSAMAISDAVGDVELEVARG